MAPEEVVGGASELAATPIFPPCAVFSTGLEPFHAPLTCAGLQRETRGMDLAVAWGCGWRWRLAGDPTVGNVCAAAVLALLCFNKDVFVGTVLDELSEVWASQRHPCPSPCCSPSATPNDGTSRPMCSTECPVRDAPRESESNFTSTIGVQNPPQSESNFTSTISACPKQASQNLVTNKQASQNLATNKSCGDRLLRGIPVNILHDTSL